MAAHRLLHVTSRVSLDNMKVPQLFLRYLLLWLLLLRLGYVGINVPKLDADSFLALCCDLRVANWRAQTGRLHCKLVHGCILGTREHNATCSGQQARYIPSNDEQYLLVGKVRPYLTQVLWYCADQTYLAYLPQGLSARQSRISTWMNSSEFACDRFQQPME